MNCHAPLWNHSQIGYRVFSLLLCVARFGHEHSVHGYDSESVYVSDNGVLTMTLLLALDQSRTCRHVINWEEGDGVVGIHTREREGRRVVLEGSEDKASWFIIPSPWPWWLGDAAQLDWLGLAMPCTDPLLNHLSVPTVFRFTPQSLSFPVHSFPPTWLLIWNITRCETWTTQL